MLHEIPMGWLFTFTMGPPLPFLMHLVRMSIEMWQDILDCSIGKWQTFSRHSWPVLTNLQFLQKKKKNKTKDKNSRISVAIYCVMSLIRRKCEKNNIPPAQSVETKNKQHRLNVWKCTRDFCFVFVIVVLRQTSNAMKPTLFLRDGLFPKKNMDTFHKRVGHDSSTVNCLRA